MSKPRIPRLARHFPLYMRKQVYLPDITLSFIRTPFLPPRYASFWVPLSFNKLDMKDYMRRVYGVDVLNVRSYVEQQKITRLLPRGRQGYGKLRRPMSKKKMTIEMTEQFVWPKDPEDFSPWEKETYFASQKEQDKLSESRDPDASKKAPREEREQLSEQAKQLMEGKQSWRPTWQALGLNYDRPLVPEREQNPRK